MSALNLCYDGDVGEIVTHDDECELVATVLPSRASRRWDRDELGALFAAAPETAAERDRLRMLNAELAEALRHALRFFPTEAEMLDHASLNGGTAPEFDHAGCVIRAVLAKQEAAK